MWRSGILGNRPTRAGMEKLTLKRDDDDDAVAYCYALNLGLNGKWLPSHYKIKMFITNFHLRKNDPWN